MARFGNAEIALGIEAVGRFSNRARRELIFRCAPFGHLAHLHHAARLDRHHCLLPPLDLAAAKLLEAVRTEGATLTALDRLGVAEPGSFRAAAHALEADLAGAANFMAQAREPQNAIRLNAMESNEGIAVTRWGLQDRLIDIAENYLGLPVMYWGAEVRCDVADGKSDGFRQWHRDAEDHRQFKILIWLHDVTLSDGPLEYVHPRRTADLSRSFRYVSGYVDGGAIAAMTTESDRIACPGPALTAVVVDPAKVFHRLMPPLRRNRYSITFAWTSRSPRKPFPPTKVTSTQYATLTEGLTTRQLECLPPFRLGS